MTSCRGLWTLCNSPETPTHWKSESVTHRRNNLLLRSKHIWKFLFSSQKLRSVVSRITLDNVIIGLKASIIVFISSATSLPVQKPHGPFLGLKSFQSTTSTMKLVTKYWPSSRSSSAKSSFKVCGSSLISSPSSSTTWNHKTYHFAQFCTVLHSFQIDLVHLWTYFHLPCWRLLWGRVHHDHWWRYRPYLNTWSQKYWKFATVLLCSFPSDISETTTSSKGTMKVASQKAPGSMRKEKLYWSVHRYHIAV